MSTYRRRNPEPVEVATSTHAAQTSWLSLSGGIESGGPLCYSSHCPAGSTVWRDIVSALRLGGYDYVISIEHEDALMSGDEGLAKGVAMLQEVNIFEQPGEMFWA